MATHSLLVWNNLQWIPATEKEMLDSVKQAQGYGDFGEGKNRKAFFPIFYEVYIS